MSMINDRIQNAMNMINPVSNEAAVLEFDYSAMKRSMKRAMADSGVEVNLVVDGKILARPIIKPMIRNWRNWIRSDKLESAVMIPLFPLVSMHEG